MGSIRYLDSGQMFPCPVIFASNTYLQSLNRPILLFLHSYRGKAAKLAFIKERPANPGAALLLQLQHAHAATAPTRLKATFCLHSSFMPSYFRMPRFHGIAILTI